MTRGEVTPLVHARGDTEHYQAGLAMARNVCVLRYGGVTRTPGTLYEGLTKNNAKKSRFIGFEFNRSQVYAVEAGDLYFRFWTPAGRIEVASVPVEVVTPYLEVDLKYLRVRQSGDVLYIWCRKADGSAYQPRTLTRTSETVWTLATYNSLDGPYLPINVTATTLTPAESGAVHPRMTSNTAPTGTAAATAGSAWNAFDRDTLTAWTIGAGTGFISYDFAGSTTKVCNAYWIRAILNSVDKTPIAWVFEGYDGADWIVLDSQRAQGGWTRSEIRFYTFANETAFQSYRLTIEGSDNTGDIALAEMGWAEAGDTMTPFNLTASSIVGINDGTGFQTSDVGRVIRLLGKDGKWRWAKIAARTSTTVVTIRLYGHALPDLSPIINWRLGAWSDESGWPSAGAIYEDRLTHARTEADPLGLWMSKSADYDNFETSVPIVDDDAISVRLTGGKLNDIGWLAELDDIVAGTAGSIRAVGRNNANAALGPSNARQKTETIAPSSLAEPVMVENILLFMDFFEQRLYEAAYTYEIEGYLARETSTLNEHLFASGVEEIVYVSHPHKIVVCRRYDGLLIFFTYDREQKVAGATLVDFGGVVESVMALPGDVGTDLWMTVQRTVNGSTVRYVERLAEFWREDTSAQDAPLYAACGAIYDGAPVTSITTADHLIGATVGIWADGRDIGDAVVNGSGDFTLPGGVSASTIAYGLRMDWRIDTLRLTQIGNRDGSGLGRKANIVEGFVDLFESAGIECGSLSVQDLLTFEDEAEADPDAAVTLRTGMYSLKADDSWKNNGVVVIKGDRMYPATIRAVQMNVDGEP